MDSPFIIPLAVFAVVSLIVAIICLVKIRDKEIEVHQSLRMAEIEHQRKMSELNTELQKLK